MEKIWLKHYPDGVPAEIDPDRFSSLVQIFNEACGKFEDKPAFANLGHTITFGELNKLSTDVAAYLQKELGLIKGDRVAVMMPNLLQYPIVVAGILKAGLVAVNVNPLYTSTELEHQLVDSEAKAIIIVSNFAHKLAEIVDNTRLKHVIVTDIGDLLPFPKWIIVNFVVKHVKKMVPSYHIPRAVGLRAALARGKQLAFDPVELTAEDIAFLQYTGGTTGVSKGAMLTHRNMVANIEQISAWLQGHLEIGNETIITALPLYHIFCLTANYLCFVKFGALNVLITNPRDIPGFVKELANWKFSAITGVNTLFNALLQNKQFAQLDFSKLKLSVGGGMAVQQAVAARWAEVTGCPISEGYGLTETSPAVTMNPPGLVEFSGSIGLPLPSTEIYVADEQANEVALGERGELCVRGPQLMRGYWRRPEETAKTINEAGWLLTGDIATVDERGFVRIVDRKKDMILVSGFNVYPNEVEEVIALHPDVLEVACIGVPDVRSGEAVKAFVVARPGTQLTAEDVCSHCRKHLTGYKVPDHVEFRDELPKTNVGKVLRRELREAEG